MSNCGFKIAAVVLFTKDSALLSLQLIFIRDILPAVVVVAYFNKGYNIMVRILLQKVCGSNPNPNLLYFCRRQRVALAGRIRADSG